VIQLIWDWRLVGIDLMSISAAEVILNDTGLPSARLAAASRFRFAKIMLSASAFQMLVAFAPIAAFLDPFQAAIGVGRFVGLILIRTGFEARLVGLFVGMGGRNCGGKYSPCSAPLPLAQVRRQQVPSPHVPRAPELP
jgi:hypothetical protein